MAQSALRVLSLLAIASAAFAQCTDGTAFIPATADGTYDKVLCVHTDGSVSVEALEEPLPTYPSQVKSDINGMWLIIGGVMVFFMQAGFAMLEAGSVPSMTALNVVFKNFMDAGVGAIAYWLFGWAFAYGNLDAEHNADNAFIGGSSFAISRIQDSEYALWFFQFAFTATAATIVSGSVAGRCRIQAYLVYSTVISGFVYPVISHWIWDTDGWLSSFNAERIFDSEDHPTAGVIDFAGSGVVHMTGGLCALVATYFVGPRQGRFEKVDGRTVSKPIEGHSKGLIAVGVFILWTCWYFFNCGSTLAVADGVVNIAGKVAVTTTIAAASALLTVAFTSKLMTGFYDVSASLNGVLAGLVGITAGCAVVDPWAACVIGVLSGIVFMLSSRLLVKLEIDDAVDAAPIHFFCGMLGVAAPGIFATRNNIKNVYGIDNDAVSTGMQFGTQLFGIFMIIVWVGGCAVLLFAAIKYTVGLRVSSEEEAIGLDVAEHNGSFFHFGQSNDEILKAAATALEIRRTLSAQAKASPSAAALVPPGTPATVSAEPAAARTGFHAV